MNRFRTAVPALLVATALAACSDAQRQETQEAVAATAEDAERMAGDFASSAQEAMSNLGSEVADLDALYSDASDAAASGWAATREQVTQATEDIEGKLTRLRDSTGEEAEVLRAEIASDIESVTEQLDRARLEAAESGEGFVAASQETLTEIEDRLRVMQAETGELSAEARQETMTTIQQLRSQAEQLGQSVSSLSGAAAEEIEAQREQLTQQIARLSATVRREAFEMSHGGM